MVRRTNSLLKVDASAYQEPSVGPPPYPISNPTATKAIVPAGFPSGYVYDALIAVDDYVSDSHKLRTGILYKKVPSGPLSAAYIPVNLDGTKVFFYCILVGLKVGIVTDA